MQKRAIAGARRYCGISAKAGHLLLWRQAPALSLSNGWRLHRLVVLQPTRLPPQDARRSDGKFPATAAIIAWSHAKRSMARSRRKNFSPACIEFRPGKV